MHKSLSNPKRWLSLTLGTAITLILLNWVLRDVSWGAVWQILARSHWGWFGLGWVAYLLCYGVRAYRWGILLAGQGFQSSFRDRLVANLVGYGSSSFLPAYLGEVFRAGILNRTTGVPMELSLGSILAERMLDIGVVLLFLVLPLSLHTVPSVSDFNTAVVMMLCLGLMGLWGLCILGARNPQKTIQTFSPVLGFIKQPALKAQLEVSLLHFLGGLTALSQPQRCLGLLLQTLGVWLLNGITYWTALLALAEYRPGFGGALFIQSGTALAIALPSTPGYIGPFEASLRILLGLYHIPIDVILSYSIALRFLMYVTIPIIAVFLVFKLDLLRHRPKYDP